MSEDEERPCPSISPEAPQFSAKARTVASNAAVTGGSVSGGGDFSIFCHTQIKVSTRSEVFIGNCYAISPARITARFKRVTSVTIKGKPRFADFSLLPPDWGAHFTPWASVLGDSYRGLEKLYLKRMSISDDDLALPVVSPVSKNSFLSVVMVLGLVDLLS
ncbi:Transport inhibitor response 1-like [Datura stramonium]|uniref:Transport inhibitor response 1-like n=1 Tax=Datura stramonium TaxID=4076 RepID=A0ABS8SDY1_DATST|nr:Transport inhibitor response 1-like [Datura stramonium]